jgi:hypothetical protein
MNIPFYSRALGTKIISYCLNITDNEAKALFDGKFELQGAKHDALVTYLEMLESVRLANINSINQDDELARTVASIRVGNRSFYNVLREKCGGTIPETQNEDPIVEKLQILAVESFPSFLIASKGDSPFRLMFSLTPENFKMVQDCAESLKTDPDISGFFELDTITYHNIFEIKQDYVGAAGRGGTIQLVGLPQIILNNAFMTACLRNWSSSGDFLTSVKESYELLKRACRGEVFETPVFMGFKNICFPVSELTIPQGKVRSYDEPSISILHSGARPSMHGGTLQYLGFVLESTYQYIASKNERVGDVLVWPKEMNSSQESMQRTAEEICISAALGIKDTQARGLSYSWFFILDPFSQGIGVTTFMNSYFASGISVASPEATKEFTAWANDIRKVNWQHLELAIGRINMAVAGRMNPTDSFIDAVIALESLFGAAAETTFRISAAVAKLFEDDLVKRGALQKEVRKLYGLRSEVIHGNKALSPKESIDAKEKAIDLAVQALTKLIRDRPELVDMGASDRSAQLILE